MRLDRPEGLERGVYLPDNWWIQPEETRAMLTDLITKAGANLNDTYELVVSHVGMRICQYDRDDSGHLHLDSGGEDVAVKPPIQVMWT